MTPTKLLIGQILIVFVIVLAGIWFATQWAAEALAYQSELGAPWFHALGRPIYRPWALFGWWFHYDAYAPKIFDEAGGIAAASGFIGCGAAVFGSLWRDLGRPILERQRQLAAEGQVPGTDPAAQGAAAERERLLRQSTEQNVSRAGDQLTSRNFSVQPTITVRPGAPIRLLVHQDLVLKPWQEE